MKQYKYIFFDLDGTITDPVIGITNGVIYSLKRYGIKPPPREELYKFIGPPLMESYQKYYGFSEETINQMINNIPSADVRPVVHGHWIDHGSFVTCSHCKEEQYGLDTGRIYCPNCGAIMMEE